MQKRETKFEIGNRGKENERMKKSGRKEKKNTKRRNIMMIGRTEKRKRK